MEKKLMKKLDEQLTWVYFGFTHQDTSMLLIFFKSISNHEDIGQYLANRVHFFKQNFIVNHAHIQT
jgi:hypothetical protein